MDVKQVVADAFKSPELNGANREVVLAAVLTHDLSWLDELQTKETDARTLSSTKGWQDAKKHLEKCGKHLAPIAETTWAHMADRPVPMCTHDEFKHLLSDIREYMRLGDAITERIGKLNLDSPTTRVSVFNSATLLFKQQKAPGGRTPQQDWIYLAMELYRYFSVTTGKAQWPTITKLLLAAGLIDDRDYDGDLRDAISRRCKAIAPPEKVRMIEIDDTDELRFTLSPIDLRLELLERANEPRADLWQFAGKKREIHVKGFVIQTDKTNTDKTH